MIGSTSARAALAKSEAPARTVESFMMDYVVPTKQKEKTNVSKDPVSAKVSTLLTTRAGRFLVSPLWRLITGRMKECGAERCRKERVAGRKTNEGRIVEYRMYAEGMSRRKNVGTECEGSRGRAKSECLAKEENWNQAIVLSDTGPEGMGVSFNSQDLQALGCRSDPFIQCPGSNIIQTITAQPLAAELPQNSSPVRNPGSPPGGLLVSCLGRRPGERGSAAEPSCNVPGLSLLYIVTLCSSPA